MMLGTLSMSFSPTAFWTVADSVCNSPALAVTVTALPTVANSSFTSALTVAAVNAPGSQTSQVTTLAGLAGSPGFAEAPRVRRASEV